MEELIREYGTTSGWWTVLLISIGSFILGTFIFFIKDEGKVAVVGSLMAGVSFLLCVVSFFFFVNEHLTKKDNLKNWYGTEQEYVEHFDDVGERRNEKSFRKFNKEEDIEIDEIVRGCDSEVYAELSDGTVWVCIEDRKGVKEYRMEE